MEIIDPLSDVANTNLELLWAFNFDVMNLFTEYYIVEMSQINYKLSPFWDYFIAKRLETKFITWIKGNEKKKELLTNQKEIKILTFW